MPRHQGVETILSEAAKLEQQYDWLGSIESYKTALGLVSEQDSIKIGEIYENIGYAFHRAAMQGESVQEFRSRNSKAIENYEGSKKSYSKLRVPEKAGKILRCDAMIAYSNYWLTVQVPEKKKLIDQCWALAKEALRAFEEVSNASDYVKTYNQLSTATILGYFLEWNPEIREKIIREAVENGERAINFFSTIKEQQQQYELARTYAKTALYLQMLSYYFVEQEVQRRHLNQKAADYWQKANEFSEEAAKLELLSNLGGESPALGEGTDKAIMNCEKALEYGKKTRDHFVVGCGLDCLTYHTVWRGIATEDRDEEKKLYEIARQYAEDAKHHYSLISFTCPGFGVAWIEAPYVEYYSALAIFEVNEAKRRELLEKSLETAPDLISRAENSGYPEAVIYANHILSGILWRLAKIEINAEKKKALLEKALKHRNESTRVTEKLRPFHYWDRGIFRGTYARIKSELVDLSQDPETKKKMLQEAMQDYETALNLLLKGLEVFENEESISQYAVLGNGLSEYGDLLNRLYEFTDNREHLIKAIGIFGDASESYEKLNLTSRVAECHWKMARTFDKMSDHLKAAESFRSASTSYENAAKKIPQLKDFYHDHALYMQAWSEIELAKRDHEEKLYDKAKLHYQKAASLHQTTEHWNYLGSNYSAWAKLEEGEQLSRRERGEDSRNLFREASNLFADAKTSIQTTLEKIEDKDERALAVRLIEASDVRREYCIGRTELEEARMLDRQGNHTDSSIKYGVAADRFQKANETLKDESDRQELTPIVELSRAWQMMTKAEAEASPTIYMEASQLFEQAKDHSVDEKTKLLALGHSVFCKALEAGTRFEKARDMETYSRAKNNLVAAQNYYVKAGFNEASEYARATNMVLDAYMYIYKAETEIEPKEKSQYYHLAEKLLQTSIASYKKAKHIEKTEQVKRLLKSVKEEQKLVSALSEIFHPPLVASSTETFAMPSQTFEKAVGLERFDDADVQARIAVSEEVPVGEEFDFRLDLANVGKNAGLLVRIDGLIPPGFKVIKPPSEGAVENGSIDMKGRSLGPLKVESLKFSMQALEDGPVKLSPQLVYVDEEGKFRTHRPEPVTITVQPKLTFEFETKAAKDIFDFLISAFVEDYMKRRISLDKSGWRTLMDAVKDGKVSKSSVYGAGGRLGRAVSELERRGLVEMRVFPGERGRGGKVLRIRVACEKETIKRYIDRQIMNIKEK